MSGGENGMQSFNMEPLDELGVNITIPECVEFISTLLLIGVEICNKKITELYFGCIRIPQKELDWLIAHISEKSMIEM